MKKYWRNERGDLTFLTCFVMLALIMFISFMILFSEVKINSINIKNGIKMELNNLSASIYADTFRSQRELSYKQHPFGVHSGQRWSNSVYFFL